jgi:hypothetical protein
MRTARTRWNDERIDDLSQRFDRVEEQLNERFDRFDSRLDFWSRTAIVAIIAIASMIVPVVAR